MKISGKSIFTAFVFWFTTEIFLWPAKNASWIRPKVQEATEHHPVRLMVDLHNKILDVCPPPIFLHFHVVFGEILAKIIGWHPLWGILNPPLQTLNKHGPQWWVIIEQLAVPIVLVLRCDHMVRDGTWSREGGRGMEGPGALVARTGERGEISRCRQGTLGRPSIYGVRHVMDIWLSFTSCWFIYTLLMA